MRYPNRTDNTAVERLLTDIHRVLIRMEACLNIIETSMYIKKRKTKKQILKGNE